MLGLAVVLAILDGAGCGFVKISSCIITVYFSDASVSVPSIITGASTGASSSYGATPTPATLKFLREAAIAAPQVSVSKVVLMNYV